MASLSPQPTPSPVLDTNKDLSALFDLQVAATPDATALEDGEISYTYGELDRKVDALAHRLRRLGVVRDSRVGVLLGRSADYVIACLAALRAGGAFLVLEVAYPKDLLVDVLADSEPVVVLTHTEQAHKLPENTPQILLDKWESSEEDVTSGPELPALPSDDDLERLAFVSYSSGTTGKPKGIANPHRAAVLSYDLRFRFNNLHPGDRVACNVFFVWEILRPLLRGATVVTVPDDASYDPAALVELLRSKRITETLMTPTLLAIVLDRHSQLGNRCKDLRTVWLNGEVVTAGLAEKGLKALPNARLLNVYSASETHEIACGDIREMLGPEDSVCPVGPLMEPEHSYILSEQGKPVEAGESGELFIGGQLLCRGYLNLPEATAKAFKKDPFHDAADAVMYATGDTARILPSGLLAITGRVGAMIKIRGYSVQPPIVEKTIKEHLAVSHCVVVPHGDGVDRQLLAYVVRDEAQDRRTAVSVDSAGYSPVARKALADHLAAYMIPALWMEMEGLPTNAVSGKVDMKRLPPFSAPKPAAATKKAGPGDASKQDHDVKITIKDIAKLWAAAIHLPLQTVMDEQGHSFFDLGGHSLALVDLMTKLTGTYGFTVPLAGLAGNPTLEGHLKVVCAARDGHTAQVQGNLPAVLRADSVLPKDVQPRENTRMMSLDEADTVLLTGATGFLGAFLLSTLLEATSAKIVCLVRFAEVGTRDNASAGMSRLRKNLLDLGLWSDSILDRIEVLPANLSRRRFGLTPEEFDDLARRVQVIVHSAATVNLVYPYAAMQGANVFGTREMLRLACQAGATLHHISTNGVLPHSVEGWNEKAHVHVDDVPERLLDGYGQTKWVAEQLVIEAEKRGLPARIYRPGTISGHSTSGSTNPWDMMNALIVESLQLGHFPDVPGWYAEMTPVDFVSRAITVLANDTKTTQRIFHVGDANPMPTADVFGRLAELGYVTEPMAYDDWLELWNEKRGHLKGGDGSFTIDVLRHGMPSPKFLQWVTVLNDSATRPVLAYHNLYRPGLDLTLLKTYTRHFRARGWLPLQAPPLPTSCATATQKPSSSPPPNTVPTINSTTSTSNNIMGPLAGKVAVVTGASSGIGAAVAAALSREGAHVALAARRTDALESLKTRLTSKDDAANSGAKVMVHSTDVTKRTQVESLCTATRDQLGPIDILVSCAGVMYFTMMKNNQVEEWDRTVDVNCKGLLHAISSAVPGMLAQGGGHFVAISSDAGRKVFPGLGVYSASKFFVEATLQSLRLETAGTGLRVTAVQPGNVATELLGMSTDQEALKKFGEPSGAKVLDPEDVAGAIVYALKQPAHVSVNEVLIEPRDEPI